MTTYFKSEAHKLAFALNHLSGRDRMNLMGITTKHIFDRGEAVKWYFTIKQELIETDLFDSRTEMMLERVYKELL